MQQTKVNWKSSLPSRIINFYLYRFFFKGYFGVLFVLTLFFTLTAQIGFGQTIDMTDANKPQNGVNLTEISFGQKNIVLFGFGVTVNGPLTISDFNIGVSSPENKSYFGNVRLYRSADNISSSDDVLIGSTATFKKTNLNLGISETYNSSAETNAYYFLVGDYTNPTAEVPGSVQFNFTGGQKEDAIIHSNGIFNNFNISGTNFIISPPKVFLSNENSVTNGISPALITYSQKNIVLFGFGVAVEGISTLDQFNIMASNTIGSYFTNGRFYRSEDNMYSADDILISSVSINKSVKNELLISDLIESFNGPTARYYFLVADYTNNGPVLNNTIRFEFLPSQATEAVGQSEPQNYRYNSFDIPGQVFVFAKTADWLGNDVIDPSRWNNAANWSGRFVPSSSDIANLGILSFLAQPVVSADITVGSINLGTKQAVILSVDSSVTLNAGDIIQKAGNVSVVNTLTGKGNLIVNNLYLTDPGSSLIFTADRTSKILSNISKLTGNHIILRSLFSGYKNDASFEVLEGTVSIAATIQTINSAGSNTSAFSSGNQSVIKILAPVPFNRSAAGSTIINLAGTTVYNGSSAQIVETFAGYNNLLLEGAGIKTISSAGSGPLKLSGSLSIKSPAAIAYSTTVTALDIRGNFEGDATLNSLSLPVNIGGNWSNSAKQAIVGNVTYDGSGDQVAGALHYTNVSFLNGGQKQLADSAFVKGNLQVGMNTVLHTDGKLKLIADSTGNANIGPLGAGADIIGNVSIQSFVKGGKRGYLTLSSPVYDLAGSSPVSHSFTYAQLKKVMPVTGPFGPPRGFDQGAIVNPYGATIRLFREEAAPGQAQYYNVDNITSTIGTGRGFNFFFRGNRSNIYNKVNQPYITPENVTIEYIGNINKGNLKIPLSYTPHSGASDNGFNLVGNPYPSLIDLQSVLSANALTQAWILKIDNTYAVYDANLGTGTNGASRYLIPGQGFFVMAREQGQTLGFTEDHKVSINNLARIMVDKAKILSRTQLSQHKSQYLNLKLQGEGTDLSDECIIVFKNGSSRYRTPEDARYMGEGKILLGTLSSDEHLLSINYLPAAEAETEIRLQVKGEESGNYKLSFSNPGFSGFSAILLMDLLLNKVVNLYDHPSYSFGIDQSVPGTFGTGRFKLIFKRSSDLPKRTQSTVSGSFASEIEAARSSITVFPNPVDSQLYIKMVKKTNPVELQIIDMAGRFIKTTVLNYSDIIIHDIAELSPGAYLLQLTDSKSKEDLAKIKFIKK